jgi:MFS family permease
MAQRTERVPATLPFGWWPAIVLVAVNLVDGGSDSLVAAVLPSLQDHFGFGDAVGGAIPTTAAVVGLLVLLPAGYLADHFRRTRVLTIVVALWVVFSATSGLAVGLLMFFLARVGLGAAANIDNPNASSLIADYYPAAVRGRVYGYQRVAWVVGVALGLLVGGGLAELSGWRTPFFVMAGAGVIITILCTTLREPPRGALDADDTSDLDTLELEGDLPRTDWRTYVKEVRALLRIPTVRYLFIGVPITFIGFNGVAFWLPTFFQRTHDLGEGTAGAITGGVGLIAALGGAVVGGVWGDRTHTRGPAGRIAIVGFSLMIGGLILIAGVAVPPLALQIVIIAAGAFTLMLSTPNTAAAAAEVIPAARRGAGFAILNVLILMGAAFGPLLIGAVSALTGSLRVAMIIAFLPTLPGSLIVLRARATAAADAARIREIRR